MMNSMLCMYGCKSDLINYRTMDIRCSTQRVIDTDSCPKIGGEPRLAN